MKLSTTAKYIILNYLEKNDTSVQNPEARRNPPSSLAGMQHKRPSIAYEREKGVKMAKSVARGKASGMSLERKNEARPVAARQVNDV